MRNALRTWITLLFVLGLGGCTFLDDMCGNTLVTEKISPGGTRKVIVYYTDCGATTAYTPNVSIVRAGESLPKQPARTGNILAGANASLDVGVKWQSDTELLVCYVESYRQEDNQRIRRTPRYAGVTVNFVLGTGSPWECDE